MGWIELILTGIGLSMDAFAVAMCKGLGLRTFDKKRALLIGAFFGGFQALMPLIGWLLGQQFEHLITNIDHWVVFALLVLIGGKMIVEAVRGEEEEIDAVEPDAVHLGRGGQIEHRVQVDRRLGTFAFADHARPRGVVEFGEVVAGVVGHRGLPRFE